MLAVDNIVKIALRESDGPSPDVAVYTAAIKSALESPEKIPTFSNTSRPLDLVRFRCLLQDTGYPAEVYLPEEAEDKTKVDWSKLQERWVGWAVEIPGEQAWADLRPSSAGNDVADALASLSLHALPPPVKGKFPLPSHESYRGALLKVYESDASFRPAAACDVVGIVSTAPLPTPFAEGEEVEDELVPAIHVLLPPTPAFPPATAPADVPTVRASLISHLANAFSPPDAVAAELLLLSLIAYPASRPGGMPLGTLTLNLIRPAGPGQAALTSLLESITPAVVPLPITLPLLHSAAFRPASDGNALSPGLLQLAPGTLLVINEDGLGNGGALAEKAVKNVQALTDAISDQSLRYDYPYTDGVRIECALRSVITSEGKSLLPADVNIPVALADKVVPATDADLAAFRAYLSSVSAPAHSEKLQVPEAVGQVIQDTFVEDRRASGSGSAEAAEGRLRRRMKIARLMATSYPAAELTTELWERTVAIDAEVEKRLKQREEKRREGKLGAPTSANTTSVPAAAAGDDKSIPTTTDKSVSFTYAVDPPPGVDAASATLAGKPVPASGSVSARIAPNTSTGARSATEAFYAGAVPALRDAQTQLNDTLTAWKDAVGDSEKHKENTGKAAKGQGKAARLMMANKAAEAESEESDDESSEEA